MSSRRPPPRKTNFRQPISRRGFRPAFFIVRKGMKTYEEKIPETISDVIEFTWSYAIWWELVNKENFQRYSKAREAYPNFFQAMIGSFQQGLCVITHRLFDEGKNNKIQSLPKLINHLKSSNSSLARQLHG